MAIKWARSLEETFLPSSDIVEALREIAEQVALLRADVQHAELELLRSRGGPALEAAREELLNVLNILEAEVGSHAPPQTRDQISRILSRARQLLGMEQ